MERIAMAMQDGGAGAGARHEAAARAARSTSFCLAAEPLYGPPGRGDFLVSNFHPGAIPGNLVRNDSDGEEVLAGKWGGLFLGYLLGKNFRRNDDACGGERAADPLHCRGIDSELFGNDTHTGSPGAARAYPNSLRHLRSSLARRYHPADSNCERIRSEHFLDLMKQRHSPLLRSGPPV